MQDVILLRKQIVCLRRFKAESETKVIVHELSRTACLFSKNKGVNLLSTLCKLKNWDKQSCSRKSKFRIGKSVLVRFRTTLQLYHRAISHEWQTTIYSLKHVFHRSTLLLLMFSVESKYVNAGSFP